MGPLSRPLTYSGQWSQTTTGISQAAARLSIHIAGRPAIRLLSQQPNIAVSKEIHDEKQCDTRQESGDPMVVVCLVVGDLGGMQNDCAHAYMEIS